MAKQTPTELLANLSQFTGTTQWWKHPIFPNYSRPIANGLKDKALVIDQAIGEDKQVYPYQLLDKAREVVQEQDLIID